MLDIEVLRKGFVPSLPGNLSVGDTLSRGKKHARKTAPKDPAFGRRFFEAWMELQKEEGRLVSLAEIGKRVAAVEQRYDEEGQLDPYSHATVSGWKSGTRPEARTIRAIAIVLACDEAWLLRKGSDPAETGARRVSADRRR